VLGGRFPFEKADMIDEEDLPVEDRKAPLLKA
jgi:hypothetical protein